MSCRALHKWVWRQGAEALPTPLRDHVAVCSRCRALVKSVQLLDHTITEDSDCEPDARYWETLPVRVQQRLGEGRQVTIRPVPARLRWSWSWSWAPATAVAVLALLIGRSIVREYSTPPLMESEVPVVGTVSTLPTAPGTTGPETPPPGAVQPDATRTRASASMQTGPRLTAAGAGLQPATSAPVSPTPTSSGEVASQQAAAEDVTTRGEEGPVADRPAVAHTDDGRVWPKRQVTIMGQIAADTPGRLVADELGPAAQDAFSAYERQMAQGFVANETAGTSPFPGPLLEAPRHAAPAGFADSQSPAEAMRRFDEIADLRSQIGVIQAVAPHDRSDSDQARLAALWYRLGMICQESALVDSAIQVVDGYIRITGESGGSDEWTSRRSRLQERRSAMAQ